MSKALVWLRQDLRLQDNPALYHAVQEFDAVIPIYIYDESANPLGGAQQWWLHHSLQSLQTSFAKYQMPLILKRGAPLTLLKEIIKQHQITAVFWNRCYEPAIIKRDAEIKQTLQAQGVAVQSYNASLLLEPWQIKNQQGSYFRVFTPYWRACCQEIKSLPYLPLPKFNKSSTTLASDQLADWNLLPNHPDWSKGIQASWQPGEPHAIKQLNNFITQGLKDYTVDRDRPGILGTSHLSPYLHFGEISPWRIWDAIKQQEALHPGSTHSCERYLAELGWREFSYYLLYHFPELPNKNFRDEFDKFPWQKNSSVLKAWQQGKTGYPIVDAGMRELWHTGYMHNRVRMITASFLTKDLLIDWRAGAEWFLDTLVDADLASNSASWQWVAGSGADAAPYFRIFNPLLQGEKFDPEGTYVKRWIPELATLPAKYIHQPSDAPDEILKQAKVVLGENYPLPIINHDAARKNALEIYKQLRDNK